jgi:serine/threonine protein phosphatase PrpC
VFSNKYGHPNGIGLYGPGKIKISKDKPISASSRGPNRWNKSPATSKNSRGKASKMMSNFHNRKMSSNLDEIRKVNNFMNNSHHKDDTSPMRDDQDSRRQGSRDKKQRKKSNSKLSGGYTGTDQNTALKELLQLKEGNNPMMFNPPKTSKEMIDSDKISGTKTGNTFNTRKFSVQPTKSEKNALRDAKISNRSRKSHSSKHTERGSRADSRDTSTRSHKEDSKTAYHDDKPANIQAPDTDNGPHIDENTNIVTKFAFATRVGYIPNNPYKVNQDAYVLAPNIMKLPAFHYFGVCDGHGQNGKEVSGYCKQRLPVLLESFIKSTGDDKKALAESFVTVNTELDYVPFDCQFSGTTCCTILFKGNRLISANSGDSRAIVVRNSPNQSTKGVTSIQVEQLTRDHKPDEQDEYTRIIAQGGRVEAFKDQNGDPMGPMRVWIQAEDVPGLAMSRSLGDKVAQSVGVLPDPEILDYTLCPQDQFILIASDGVFEFMSNVDVARLVFPYVEKNAPEAAANVLVKEATKRWKKEEEVIDDITCIIIFLDVKS